MRAKTWLLIWIIIIASSFCYLGSFVYRIDPYFHYHKPLTDKYYYDLPSSGRNLDDGIIKHFDYEGMVIGTSLVKTTKPSEVGKLFGCNFIKTPLAGASFREINNNIQTACDYNPNLKIVIRCLDMDRFYDSCNFMRTDLGKYPTYLYDNNPFNDFEYLLNKEVIFDRIYPMILESKQEDFTPGIKSFDDYSNWQYYTTFGIDAACPGGLTKNNTDQEHLSDKGKDIIKKNVLQNVTSLTDAYPDIDFYYYFPPYSVIRWNEYKDQGILVKTLEAKAFITELILQHDNIHLFSFNNITEITTDLNHYKDNVHYAEWVNSFIMECLHDGRYQLTKDNYKDDLKKEYDFYTTFDYESVNDQEDYEEDYYAAAQLNSMKTGTKPIDVLNDSSIDIEFNCSECIVSGDQNIGINCVGTLDRDSSSTDLQSFLRDNNPIGARFTIDLDNGYNYLCFNGQKIVDHGNLNVFVYNENGDCVASKIESYEDLDDELHQYVIDLSNASGKVLVVLNGGYADNSGSSESCYQFSNIFVY